MYFLVFGVDLWWQVHSGGGVQLVSQSGQDRDHGVAILKMGSTFLLCGGEDALSRGLDLEWPRLSIDGFRLEEKVRDQW